MTATVLERVPLSPQLLASLRQRLGDRLSTSAAVLEQHGKDESYHAPSAPDAVAFAQSAEEVIDIVALCAEHKTPVIAFGTGTSLEGHVAALKGGVCIDLSQMNRVLRVNAEDLDATVEAGVTRKQLNEYLRDTGLFFPIDPGADASLGGGLRLSDDRRRGRHRDPDDPERRAGGAHRTPRRGADRRHQQVFETRSPSCADAVLRISRHRGRRRRADRARQGDRGRAWRR